MEILIKKIENWGRQRTLDHRDVLMQTTKTLEEIMELQQAIIKKDIKETEEQIGHITVTLIMICMQLDLSFHDTYLKISEETIRVDYSKANEDYPLLKSIELINGIAKLQESLVLTNSFSSIVEDSILKNLYHISHYYQISYLKSVQKAYYIIRDRTGIIENDLFIKE